MRSNGHAKTAGAGRLHRAGARGEAGALGASAAYAITLCMPDGTPAPGMLTTDELIRFLRISETQTRFPESTIRYYREKGLLRGVQVGRAVRYPLTEVLRFLDRLQESNPR